MPYLLLALAILSEVCATSFLKLTDGYTRLWPTVAVVVGYVLSFALFGRALTRIPVSVAYAVWSGVGTVSIAAIGATAFRESLGWIGWAGVALVVAGVVLLNVHHAH